MHVFSLMVKAEVLPTPAVPAVSTVFAVGFWKDLFTKVMFVNT